MPCSPRNSQILQGGAAALQSILGAPWAGLAPLAAAEILGLPLIPAVLIPAAHLLDGDESPDAGEEEEEERRRTGLAGGSWKAACAALPCALLG